MSSIAGLERRLKRLVAQIEPPSKTWTFALEPDEPIPAEAAARIRPNDRVIVQEIPVGFLSGLDEQQEEVGTP